MKLLLPAVTLAVTLLLTSCGGSDTDSADAPASESSGESTEAEAEAGPGVYSGTAESGLTVTVEIPTPEAALQADPTASAVEQYRIAARAPEFTYLLVELDNTQGTEEQLILDTAVVVIDEFGVQLKVEHVFASDAMYETHIFDKAPEAANELYSETYDNQRLLPGAKGTFVYATDDPLPEPVSVFITTDFDSFPLEKRA
jgi:hypothetical protein